MKENRQRQQQQILSQDYVNDLDPKCSAFILLLLGTQKKINGTRYMSFHTCVGCRHHLTIVYFLYPSNRLESDLTRKGM